MTAGLLNITALNQSTHCIVVIPLLQTVDTPNQPPICGDKAAQIVAILRTILAG